MMINDNENRRTVRKNLPAIFVALGAALLAGCSAQQTSNSVPQATATDAASAPAAALHPESGLEVIPLTVTGAGGTHRFSVEVASSPQDRAQGLMFRTVLGPDEGMLFPSASPAQQSFWMKNTPLPLDIIFIGTDGRISNIAANTTPYSLDSVTSTGLASAVLEIPGGRAAELGIMPGDRVEWQAR